MEFESKMLSRGIQEILYDNDLTLGTAESCTGGRIAEAIISVPGASQYFKGGIICYTNEVKENLLHVSHQVLEEQTAVCEEVARQMVLGACDALNCKYAISAIGYGSKDDVRTLKLTEDFGRDINLAIATNKALRLFLEYLKEKGVAKAKTEE